MAHLFGRNGEKAARKARPAFVVPVHISDKGVVSVAAADVLKAPGVQEQIEAVRRLRLASERVGKADPN
jgi:hypothetical protein